MAGMKNEDQLLLNADGRVSSPSGVPSSKKAVGLIGGKAALEKLHQKGAKLAAAAAPTRLQLAIAVTKRHYLIDTEQDLKQSIKATLDDAWEQQHMLWSLNKVDGPWAQGMSQGQFVWAPLTDVAELTALSVRGDFVEMIYLHLR